MTFLRKLIALLIAGLMAAIPLFSTATGYGHPQLKVEYEDFAKTAAVYEETDSWGGNNLVNANYLYWKTADNGSVTLDFGAEKTFNTVILREMTDNVQLFRLYSSSDGEHFKMFYEQDRIDTFRLCAFEDTTARYLKLEIVEQSGPVRIRDMQVSFAPAEEKDFRVNGYLTHGNNQIQNRLDDEGFLGYFDVLTDVIMIGETNLDKDGTLYFNNGEAQFAADLAALRQAIGGRDVDIWVCVFFRMTNPDSAKDAHDQTAEAITNHIEKIAQNLSDFAQKYDLKGIDFDWEYPSKRSQWKAYDLIINETAAKLAPSNRGISVALPPWGVGLSQKAINNLDCVNLMCYDLFDTRHDHASIYYAGARALEYMQRQGYPKEKVFLGAPFYGRAGENSTNDWPNYSSAYNPQTNTSSLGKFGNQYFTYEYDEAGNPIKSNVAYLDGYAEMRDKTATALALGYSGMMVFEVKCDAPYTYQYSLHRAIGEILNQRTK